jgi:hypothetical protein
MNYIELIVGDPFKRGHAMKSTVRVECTQDAFAVSSAYKEGCAVVGFDITEEYSSDDSNEVISEERVEILKSIDFAGVIFHDKDGLYRLSPRSYAEIYMFIANIGDSSIKYKVLNDPDYKLEIGGYGIFNKVARQENVEVEFKDPERSKKRNK